MTINSNQHDRPVFPRFHSQRGDGRYAPIAYLFVTEAMCSAIQHERNAILDALPATERNEQTALFAQYDPQRYAQAFQALLRLFNGELSPSMAQHALHA